MYLFQWEEDLLKLKPSLRFRSSLIVCRNLQIIKTFVVVLILVAGNIKSIYLHGCKKIILISYDTSWCCWILNPKLSIGLKKSEKCTVIKR